MDSKGGFLRPLMECAKRVYVQDRRDSLQVRDLLRGTSPTHCNALQHTATASVLTLALTAALGRTTTAATHCNILQYTAIHCNALQRTATHCNALQRITSHCNTPHHTATHRNTLQHTATTSTLTLTLPVALGAGLPPRRCNTMQHTATHCDTLRHTATHCNTNSQRGAVQCSAVQNMNVSRQETSYSCVFSSCAYKASAPGLGSESRPGLGAAPHGVGGKLKRYVYVIHGRVFICHMPHGT